MKRQTTHSVIKVMDASVSTLGKKVRQFCYRHLGMPAIVILLSFVFANSNTLYSQDNCNLTPAKDFNLTIWERVDGSQGCITFRQGTMTNYGSASNIYQFKNSCNNTVYFMVCVTLQNGRKTTFSMHIDANSCSRYAIPEDRIRTMKLVRYAYGGEYGRNTKVIWKDCDY